MQIVQYTIKTRLEVLDMLSKCLHEIDPELGAIKFYQHGVWQCLPYNNSLKVDDYGLLHVLTKS